MIGTLKMLAVVGSVGAAAALGAQPARADHVSFGIGIGGARVYHRAYITPSYYNYSYYTPAAYAAPAYIGSPPMTYYQPAYGYTPGYCPPPVVYQQPYYYAAPTYVYSAPSYYYSQPYYQPSFSIGFGFGGFGGGHFGGGGHFDGGGHHHR